MEQLTISLSENCVFFKIEIIFSSYILLYGRYSSPFQTIRSLYLLQVGFSRHLVTTHIHIIAMTSYKGYIANKCDAGVYVCVYLLVVA